MSQLVQQKMAEMLEAITDFTMQPQARVLRLEATDNDFKLAQHCLSMLARQQLESPDVVVMIEAPFDTGELYSHHCVVALCEAYDRLVDILPIGDDDTSSLPPWEPEFVLSHESDETPETGQGRLHRLTAQFIDVYGDYFDKLVYVFLPPTTGSHSGWAAFLKSFIDHTSSKLKWGVIENLTPLAPLLEELNLGVESIYHYRFKGQTYDIMADVLTELEAQGQPMDFQRHLTELFQYQEKKQSAQALISGEKALHVAVQQGLPAWQVVALTSLYATHVSLKDYQQAQSQAQQALEVSQGITVEELPSRDNLVAMSYANLGTAQLLNRRYDLAALSYQEAATYFELQGNWLMGYENHRMSALCYTQLNQHQEAWEAGGDAFVAFYQTPSSLWSDSTLPHLGKNLQSIANQQQAEEVTVFEAHMQDCLGEDWRALLADVALPKLPAQQNTAEVLL